MGNINSSLPSYLQSFECSCGRCRPATIFLIWASDIMYFFDSLESFASMYFWYFDIFLSIPLNFTVRKCMQSFFLWSIERRCSKGQKSALKMRLCKIQSEAKWKQLLTVFSRRKSL